jgi:capsular exopolysaccharide synthesis family protein
MTDAAPAPAAPTDLAAAPWRRPGAGKAKKRDIVRPLAVLWRRKLSIVTGVAITTALAWSFAVLWPPTYTAHAALLLEADNIPLSAIASEAEVLRSRGLAEAVIEDLDLMDDPDFNPHLHAIPAEDKKFKSLSVHRAVQDSVPAGVMDRALGQVIEGFIARLDVDAAPDSRVLHIRFRDSRAPRAALVANRIAALYAERRLAAALEAREQVTRVLAARLEKAQEDMSGAEDSLLQFAASQQVPVKMESIGAIPPHPLSAYRAEVDAARATVLHLSARYGAKHPKMKAAQAVLAAAQKRLQQATDNNDIPPPLPPAGGPEKSAVAGDGGDAAHEVSLVTLPLLERQAASARKHYESVMRSVEENESLPQITGPGVRLISAAVIPAKPSFPPRRLVLLAGAGGGFVVFCLLALAGMHTRRTFRSAQELEDYTGLPCYALIPETPARHGVPADAILAPQAANMAESVRSLRAMLALRAAPGQPRPRVVSITSSYPGEGKTTLSAWLARAAAKGGERVIVVDADMRRPSLHKAFARTRGKTLVDYLSGDARLEDIVQTGDAGGVHMIFANAVPGRALDLLAGDKLHRLVAALRKTYDLVILDAPACMAVTDPLLLARQADLTLYNITWNDTPAMVIDMALRQFGATDYARLGLVLNRVDLAAHAAYGYGDVRYDYTPGPEAAAKT